MSESYDTIVVGAGLAGLACARTLDEHGKRVLLIESTDRIGGRLRTDVIDGFHLDHGFQILLTSYPTAAKLLNFSQLNLGTFLPGARIYRNAQYETVADPFRQPSKLLSTITANIGSFADKFRLLSLSRFLAKQDDLAPYRSQTTRSFLEQRGFQSPLIDAFFQPFYGGVFLESNLDTSAAVFAYTFKRFAQGLAAIPEGGMAAIPQHLGADLQHCETRLNTRVENVEKQRVTTSDGETFTANTVVLATPFHVSDALLGRKTTRQWKSTTCLYFAAAQSPLSEPILALNGTSNGRINLVCVPSMIAEGLAPQGQALINVSLRTADASISPAIIQQELENWFGDTVRSWSHLKTYHVEHALPASRPEDLEAIQTAHSTDGIHVCGDHVGLATIEHALQSGHRTALEIISRGQA